MRSPPSRRSIRRALSTAPPAATESCISIPNSSLTRAQAATMIGRTQEKGYATAELAFTDAGSIPAYATYYIQTMVAQGVISGYTDGSFKPQANITRGQMAKILYNLM
ncbi:MAG: S-layer homology domain-containing protein [Oscillospiraceae bacterium]